MLVAAAPGVSELANAQADDEDAREKALYFIMQSVEGRLGGGEGIEGLYGSLKRLSMQKVLDCLVSKCGLSGKSHLVDVGAGLGRPLLHAKLRPGVASATGIELDQIKCAKATAFMAQTMAEMLRREQAGLDLNLPTIQCSAIEKVKTLDPATHAYSFWEGVPMDGKAAFGRLFATSSTLQAVAIVQRAMRGAEPTARMAELGFGSLSLVSRFPVSMSGSGRKFTAYVFKRRAPVAAAFLPPHARVAVGLGQPSGQGQVTGQHSAPSAPPVHRPVLATGNGIGASFPAAHKRGQHAGLSSHVAGVQPVAAPSTPEQQGPASAHAPAAAGRSSVQKPRAQPQPPHPHRTRSLTRAARQKKPPASSQGATPTPSKQSGAGSLEKAAASAATPSAKPCSPRVPSAGLNSKEPVMKVEWRGIQAASVTMTRMSAGSAPHEGAAIDPSPVSSQSRVSPLTPSIAPPSPLPPAESPAAAQTSPRPPPLPALDEPVQIPAHTRTRASTPLNPWSKPFFPNQAAETGKKAVGLTQSHGKRASPVKGVRKAVSPRQKSKPLRQRP